MKRKTVALVAPMVVLALAGCRTQQSERTEEAAGLSVTPNTAVSPEETVSVDDEAFVTPMTVTRNTAVSPEETVRESSAEEVVVVPEEFDEELTVTDDVVVDELGDEGAIADLGAAGERNECGLVIEATSAGAVGDPCLTNVEFMRSLGLSDGEISRVEAASELP